MTTSNQQREPRRPKFYPSDNHVYQTDFVGLIALEPYAFSMSPQDDRYGAIGAAPSDEILPAVRAIQTSPAASEADLARHAFQADAFSAQARAFNTQRAYRSSFADYAAWCDRLGIAPLSGDPQLVGMYLAGLPERQFKYATIRMRVSAIAAAHRAAGLVLDLKDPRIARVMDGIARTVGTRAMQAQPVLADELALMMRTLPSTPLGTRDRALLLIGFGGAMRRSELVALDLADLTVTDSGLKVLIRFSKTDQAGAGEEVGIHRSADPKLCPVQALQAWLALRGQEPGALFHQITRGGRVRPFRLSDRGVARAVKTAAVTAGLNPERYAGHSLRAGLATSASNAGADLMQIMNQTRHRSVDTARRYVRDAEIWRNNVTRMVLPQASPPTGARPIAATPPEPAPPVFSPPDDPDAALWRYLGFDDFAWLLRENRLYMAPVADLGDPLDDGSPDITQGRRDIREDAPWRARGAYVSCWRLGAGDSHAMWGCYAPRPDSVAIRTTYRTLRAQVPAYASIGTVCYVDGMSPRSPTSPLHDIMHKDSMYSFEREVRVVVQTPEGREPLFEANHFESTATPGLLAHAPPIDPIELVRGVVLHPDASGADEERIRALCAENGLPIPEPSRRLRRPVF